MRHLKGKTLGPKFGLFIASLLLASLFINSSFGMATNSTTLSSSGRIAYSPSPPTPPSPKGEIFLWVQFWLVDGNGNPNSVAHRIVDAKKAYGNPTWVEAGNWGDSHLTSVLINLFHSVGIKVSCRVWSQQSEKPIEEVKADIDYQLSIGPEVDMIMVDECAEWNYDYYKELSDYVHGMGKLFAVNPGGPQIWDSTCQIADVVSTEFMWRDFIQIRQNLIAQYPKKFMGIINDWSANAVGMQSVNLERAVAYTLEAWNGGVYYFEARSGEGTYLPDWWEQYLSQLTG